MLFTQCTQRCRTCPQIFSEGALDFSEGALEEFFEKVVDDAWSEPILPDTGKVNFPALKCRWPRTQQEARILNWNVIAFYYTPVQGKRPNLPLHRQTSRIP